MCYFTIARIIAYTLTNPCSSVKRCPPTGTSMLTMSCSLCPLSFAEIKTELKKKDDEFVKTLKRQAEDIDTLLHYMSCQFVEMQGAFKAEMEEIESAFLQVGTPLTPVILFMRLRD